MPVPTVPIRGEVSRTFVDARVLAGFMDDGHFRAFSGEFLSTLKKDEQESLLKKAEGSRAITGGLPDIPLQDVITRPLVGAQIESIKSNKVFQNTFRVRPFQFAWIRPERIVALQVHVKPRADPVPQSEDELIQFMLPLTWDVPAEVNFIPPVGPIYMVSSSPHMTGFEANFEAKSGKVTIQPPKHINLLQVMHFNGRYYLRNGYHRLFDAISGGIQEVPALVVEALQPQDVDIGGGFGSFNPGYTMGQKRPPLVADFTTDAAIPIKMRERRYGIAINLQVSPVNIGI